MTPAAAPAAAPAGSATASARQEPLVWLQLLGAALVPLEALALLLALAGADPGPFPWLERLLCWGIGSLAPTLLLARRPADGWSLLLAQVPLRGRRPVQQRLSAVVPSPALRLASLVVVSLLSLLLLSWCDNHGAVATDFSPLAESPRLVGLMAAAALLALLQWQGQQALQALLWLRCSPERLAAMAPLDPAAVEASRLSLGIPLLLLNPLVEEARPPAVPKPSQAVAPTPEPTRTPPQADSGTQEPPPASSPSEPAPGEAPPNRPNPAMAEADPAQAPPLEAEHGMAEAFNAPTPMVRPSPEPSPSGSKSTGHDPPSHESEAALPPPAEADLAGPAASDAGIPVAIEPEQPPADPEGGDLDQEIP